MVRGARHAEAATRGALATPESLAALARGACARPSRTASPAPRSARTSPAAGLPRYTPRLAWADAIREPVRHRRRRRRPRPARDRGAPRRGRGRAARPRLSAGPGGALTAVEVAAPHPLAALSTLAADAIALFGGGELLPGSAPARRAGLRALLRQNPSAARAGARPAAAAGPASPATYERRKEQP
ncbi:hypothetical protein ACU686_44275 [Yinghuangia aomiensis]